MTIVPDDKNWTWVLERECPECGFDAPAVDVERVGGDDSCHERGMGRGAAAPDGP